MTRRLLLLLGLCLLLPRAALADPGLFSFDQHHLFALTAGQNRGDRPLQAGGGSYLLNNGGLRWRGGRTPVQPSTTLGAQTGAWWDLQVGGMESDNAKKDIRVQGSAAAGYAVRLSAVNVPALGALVLHTGLEVGTTPAWWADGPYAAVLLGAHNLWKAGPARLELGYTFVPWTAQGTLSGLEVDRREHRVRAGLGLGPIGVGAEAAFGDEVIRDRFTEVGRTSSRRVMALLELRR